MKHKTKALLLLAAAGLAACSTSADRFGGAGGPGGSGFDAGGIAGSASDPSSVAYFQQQVGNRVQFVVDTWTLTPEAQDILRGQAQFLTANTGYTAIVDGHADERGTSEYNLALSERRAAAVRDFLVAQGVASNRLRTRAFGKLKPLETCSAEACYSTNRRAETVLGPVGGFTS